MGLTHYKLVSKFFTNICNFKERVNLFVIIRDVYQFIVHCLILQYPLNTTTTTGYLEVDQVGYTNYGIFWIIV